MANTESNNNYETIRAIGDLSGNGIFVYDLHRKKFHFFNRPFAEHLGLRPEQLHDDPSVVIRQLPEADKKYIEERFASLLKVGVVEDMQFNLRLDSRVSTLVCDAYVERERNVVVGLVRETSAGRAHEDYLIDFGARKDALLDMVAQNLSTPLNLSKFTIDLIDRAVKEKKYHKLNAHVKLIREVTSECIRIIDRFLQEEHLESRDVAVKKYRFDVMSKIAVVLERLREPNPDKHFTVKASAESVYINSDALKFFQIIHNVYSNSIKFTRPNGRIDTTVTEKEDIVEITIADDGIGIPDDIKPFIFDRKTRAARPGLKGEISNGIGLYSVSTLIGMLKGKVSFESKENKGTSFTLSFPKD